MLAKILGFLQKKTLDLADPKETALGKLDFGHRNPLFTGFLGHWPIKLVKVSGFVVNQSRLEVQLN